MARSIDKLLADQDVLYILFEQLRPVPLPTSAEVNILNSRRFLLRQTLASAARTCRAFADPASRVLWSAVDGLVPLLRLLSNLKECTRETLNQFTRKYNSESIYTFDGEVPEEGWVCFERMAARVKCFLCDAEESLDPSLVDVLVSRYSGARHRPLFVNLQSLSWPDPRNDDRHRLLRILCTPALQYVLIPDYQSGGREHDSGRQDLAAIADCAPSLLHFRADLSGLPLGGPDSVLFRLRALRSLKLSLYAPLDKCLFTHLSELPHLEFLDATLPAPGPSKSTARAGFPALRHLYMKLNDTGVPSARLSILSRISSPSLETLDLLITAHSSGAVQFVHDLCSLPVTRSLKHLSIAANEPLILPRPANATAPPAVLKFAAVALPLLALSRIEDIRLSTYPYALEVTDEDVARVAAAWPRLTTVCLRGTGTPAARPSLGALVALSERCPALTELQVEVADITAADVARLEAHVASPAYPYSSPSRSRSAVQTVALLRSDGTDPLAALSSDGEYYYYDRLARAMHRVFPCLREADAFGEGIRIYKGSHQFANIFQPETDESRLQPLVRRMFRLFRKVLVLKAESRRSTDAVGIEYEVNGNWSLTGESLDGCVETASLIDVCSVHATYVKAMR
ncbi:hypothetical protein C8Q80DRAFT_1267144 [Daedaleopsis nitida]|nr:hypothetical protein C8Q80DRAFT_1267144 [Daedaleopsis nitida]